MKPTPKTKSLDDVMLDMSVLYDGVAGGATELKVAAELANISGKYLKAYQLKLATDIFIGQRGKKLEDLDAARLQVISSA